MNQPPLFDPDRTSPTACKVPGCGSIRFPHQQRTPTCRVDRERATGDWTKRPQACLNTVDPATQPIPY